MSIPFIKLDHDSNVQATVQTRIVARILRRIAQWKQHFFRPEKPLPRGTPEPSKVEESKPFWRYIYDWIIVWLCLGLPYILANRDDYSRYDEERGGLMRNTGPAFPSEAFLIVVCLPSFFPPRFHLLMSPSFVLKAGIIMAASLIFLALPGLDNVMRTAGFIAIIGSAASLGSSVILIIRNQWQVQRLVQGGEGFVVRMRAYEVRSPYIHLKLASKKKLIVIL